MADFDIPPAQSTSSERESTPEGTNIYDIQKAEIVKNMKENTDSCYYTIYLDEKICPQLVTELEEKGYSVNYYFTEGLNNKVLTKSCYVFIHNPSKGPRPSPAKVFTSELMKNLEDLSANNYNVFFKEFF
jgi:hypothetical protein